MKTVLNYSNKISFLICCFNLYLQWSR